MLRRRILLVVSLMVLAILLVGVVFRPMVSAEQYSEVQRAELLQTEDSWVIQFDLFNKETSGQSYTINLSVDGVNSTAGAFIPPKGMFSYIKHIPLAELQEKGRVEVVVSREGEVLPLEEKTYFLEGKKK